MNYPKYPYPISNISPVIKRGFVPIFTELKKIACYLFTAGRRAGEPGVVHVPVGAHEGDPLPPSLVVHPNMLRQL